MQLHTRGESEKRNAFDQQTLQLVIYGLDTTESASMIVEDAGGVVLAVLWLLTRGELGQLALHSIRRRSSPSP